MNSLKRVLPYAGAFLLAGALVGCGDDGDSNSPDGGGGGTPDAGATPDASCEGGGHASGCVDSPFQLPEHGEFRLEQFQFAPSGTGDDDALAAQAFFFTGQTPAARSLDGNLLTLRTELAEKGYICQDFSAGNNFDNGFTPAAQAVVATREYIDIGAFASLTDEETDEVIMLNKVENGVDLSASLTHPILYQGSDTTAVNLGGTYKPAIEGVAAYPGLDLRFGQSPPGDEMHDPDTGVGDPKIYMPSDFQMTQPAEVDFFAAEGLTFTKGEDLELTYTIDAPETIGAPDDYPTIISFIGFVYEGGVDAYCLKITPGDLDDGTFTVPHEVLEIIPADPEEPAEDDFNYILFGRFTHVAWEVQNLDSPARLDFLGVTCLISPTWTVNDAPVQ